VFVFVFVDVVVVVVAVVERAGLLLFTWCGSCRMLTLLLIIGDALVMFICVCLLACLLACSLSLEKQQSETRLVQFNRQATHFYNTSDFCCTVVVVV